MKLSQFSEKIYQIVIVVLCCIMFILLFLLLENHNLQSDYHFLNLGYQVCERNEFRKRVEATNAENLLVEKIYSMIDENKINIDELTDLKVASGSQIIRKIYNLIHTKQTLSPEIKRTIAEIMWKLQTDDINDKKLYTCDQTQWRTGMWAGYYQFFVPVVGCETVYRAGILGDGGKHLCNAHKIDNENCVTYSFGSESDLSFDNHIHFLLNCRVHTFDPTVDVSRLKNQLHDYISFHEYGIGPSKSGQYTLAGKPLKTLSNIANELNHTKVDILKIDVEGSEVNVFNHIFHEEDQILDRLNVKLILIEYHYPDDFSNFNCSFKKTHLYPFLKGFYDAGYLLYRYEHNVYTHKDKCPGLCCIEYAFIRKDFV